MVYGIKAPIPVIPVPTVANEEKTPVIPKEVIVANVLPALTAPIELCIPAATLPAHISIVPNLILLESIQLHQ